jgi:hypothetical protein
LTRFRLADPQGSALVSAMLVMMICIGLTFGAFQLVDNQQGESRKERERESSFTLSEGVLNSQIYLLSRQWPGTTDLQYPPQCTKATSANALCPDSSTLQKSFTGADFNDGLDWTSEVRDNYKDPGDPAKDSSQFYDDATVRSQPRYDANADGIVWVRAQSNIQGRRRTLVALIRAEQLTALFPRNAVVANRITTTNSGAKTIVKASPSYLVLRCTGPGGSQIPLQDCRKTGKDQQIDGEVRVIPGQRPALSPETVDRFRETAKASGTYYASGCAPTLTGAIVFIEVANCGSDYNPPGKTEYNSEASPGVLIIGSGVISFGGNALYNGTIYMINGSDGYPGSTVTNGTVLYTQGTTCIRGTVVIDGPGGIEIGSSGGANRCDGNIQYRAFTNDPLKAFGTAGIVQNSFREIVASN